MKQMSLVSNFQHTRYHIQVTKLSPNLCQTHILEQLKEGEQLNLTIKVTN